MTKMRCRHVLCEVAKARFEMALLWKRLVEEKIMPYIFRYLAALALQLAWARAGKKGAAAPLRMKPGAKPMPVIGPWQMMVGAWVVKKLWARFGPEVTATLNNARHPAVRGVASIINGTPGPLLHSPAAPANTAPTPPTPVVAPSVVVSNTPNSYGTQVLDANGNATVTAPNVTARRGTLLDRLRGNA
jgi:hypothetical protein